MDLSLTGKDWDLIQVCLAFIGIGLLVIYLIFPLPWYANDIVLGAALLDAVIFLLRFFEVIG